MTDKDDSGLAPGERPTLKTIAKLAGLAVPTVSRALSDAPDIGQQTKIRVREIAKSVGYRPNRAGLRLRTGKTQVIAVVLSTDHDVTNQTAMLIESIASSLRGTSYHMVITPFFPDEDPMEAIRYVVETSAADGIIFNATMPDDPRIHYLQKINFPFACHGRSNMADTHAWFDFDHEEFGRGAIRKFNRNGRSRVLLFTPKLTLNYGRNMVNGAQEVATQCGMEIAVLEDADSNNRIEHTEAALTAYWKNESLPDAILCSSTSCAFEVIAHLDRQGLEIGVDVDVIVREFFPLLQRFRPGIITVSEDVATAGKFLTNAVLHRIDTPEEAPMHDLEIPTFAD